MNTPRSAEHDERSLAVARASLALAFFFLANAVLLDTAYRSIVRHEAPLDLVALVFVSFGIALVYQAREKALIRGWLKKMLLTALVWGMLGAIYGVILSVARAW